MNIPVNILVVDDEPRNLDVLESILQAPDWKLVRARNANEALMALVHNDFAAIVLDIQMPNMSGIELARLIKTRKRSQLIPIIFLTAHFHEDEDVLEGYSAGAVDYLTKPVVPQILRSKVSAFADMFRATRALEIEVKQREAAEEALLVANAELEARVKARTADLSQANRELQASEERYRIILESALEYAIFTTDKEGRITTWNAGAQRILGYEENEILGQPLDVIFSADDLKHGQSDIEMGRALAHGRAEDERWHVRKGGIPFWATGLMMALRDGDDQHLGFLKILRDGTNRKRDEEALRESEARFRTMADTAPVLIWIAETDRRFSYFNQPWLEFTGRTLEQEQGNGWAEGVHPDDLTRALKTFGEAFDRRVPFEMDFRLRRADGVYRWLNDRGTPRFTPDGTFLGYIGGCTDITERKQGEEVHAHLAAIIESSNDAIISKRLDGIIRSWNAAAEHIFGYSAAEAIGRPITMLIPKERLSEEGEIVARLRRGESIENFETVRLRKDGSPVEVSLTISPVRDSEGCIVAASKIARDITEQNRSASALRESERIVRQQEAQIRLITDTTPVMLTRCSRDLRFQFVNRAYAEMLGLIPEQIIGKPLPEIEGEDAYAAIRPYVETVLQGRPVEYETEIPFQRIGPRFLRLAYVPDRDEAGTVQGWMASLSDITESKQSEQRSIQLNETLLSVLEAIPDIVFVTETDGRIQFKNPAADRFDSAIGMARQLPPPVQAELERVLETGQHHLPTSLKTVHRFVINQEERFFFSRIVPMTTFDERIFGVVVMLQDVTEFRLLDEVKTNLISTVSHELKTPITSVRTALLLLLEQSIGTLNPKQAEMAGIARDEAERLLRTLNELLDLTRFEESAAGMRLEPVSPAELIQSAIAETRLSAETARVSIRVDVPDDLPSVTADRQRIVHALSNFLTNAVKYSPEGGEVVVNACRHEQGVCFSVTDHGPGVPQQFQARIFEKFVRVPGNTKTGAGLGLSIAREFVRAHKGRIGVHSEPGRGSEFFFILPLG